MSEYLEGYSKGVIDVKREVLDFIARIDAQIATNQQLHEYLTDYNWMPTSEEIKWVG
jgi:hypothetical protein